VTSRAADRSKTVPQANHPIVMTDFDFRRLEQLCELLRERAAGPASLQALEEELSRADVVAQQRVPAGVVTMNSEVLISDLDTGEQRSVKLVFPGRAGSDAACVSVLAPMGMALLGCREHEELSCSTPFRQRRLRIDRVLYQPEAAGDFTL
jgi:regulator of nucleoside diphosphate kinase